MFASRKKYNTFRIIIPVLKPLLVKRHKRTFNYSYLGGKDAQVIAGLSHLILVLLVQCSDPDPSLVPDFSIAKITIMKQNKFE